MLDVRNADGTLLGQFTIDYRGESCIWLVCMPERGGPEFGTPGQIPFAVRMWKDSSSLRPYAVAEDLTADDLRAFPDFVPFRPAR